jgi:hypothetical protein
VTQTRRVQVTGTTEHRGTITQIAERLRHDPDRVVVRHMKWHRMRPFGWCIHLRDDAMAVTIPMMRSERKVLADPDMIAVKLRDVMEGMVDLKDHMAGARQAWGTRHANAALVLHTNDHPLRDGAVMDDGSALVECLLDAEGVHSYQLQPWDGGTRMPLDVAKGRVENALGLLPIMCSANMHQGPEGGPSLCLLPAASLQEGVLVRTRLPDPLERMRMIAEFDEKERRS